MRKGAELSLKQFDPGGFEVEGLFRDTELTPDVGRRRAEELVNQENVDMITAGWSSAVGMAIHGFTRANDIPFTTYAATNRITGSECAPYTFSCAWNATTQITGTLGYALLSEGGTDRLSRAQWRSLISGTFESEPGLTTGVYAPNDPGPMERLVRTTFGDQEYYCAC